MTPPRGLRGRTASRWPVLLAVLLTLLGGSALSTPVPGSAPAAGSTLSAAFGQGAHSTPDDGHAYRPAQNPAHLRGLLTHPPQTAEHSAPPLIAAGQQQETAQHGSVPPPRTAVTAAHLTQHTPRHGRAPPLRTGI